MEKAVAFGMQHYLKSSHTVFLRVSAHLATSSFSCVRTSKFTSVLCNQISYSLFSKNLQSPKSQQTYLTFKNCSQFSTESKDNVPSDVNGEKKNELDDRKSSLIKRFKDAYAIHGKVVLVTHGVSSCVWFAIFYSLASTGINLLDILNSLNAPEWITKPFRFGGGTVNTLATALVFYKLAAPLRYGFTIIFTRYLVRYLRSKGKAPEVQESDRLRNLAKEGAEISRDRIKARIAKKRRKYNQR
ncbi:unnamed protein product [Schistosoma turkestanicum]|nr:unnamed protein product [Schistosoma turkestanicum]